MPPLESKNGTTSDDLLNASSFHATSMTQHDDDDDDNDDNAGSKQLYHSNPPVSSSIYPTTSTCSSSNGNNKTSFLTTATRNSSKALSRTHFGSRLPASLPSLLVANSKFDSDSDATTSSTVEQELLQENFELYCENQRLKSERDIDRATMASLRAQVDSLPPNENNHQQQQQQQQHSNDHKTMTRTMTASSSTATSTATSSSTCSTHNHSHSHSHNHSQEEQDHNLDLVLIKMKGKIETLEDETQSWRQKCIEQDTFVRLWQTKFRRQCQEQEAALGKLHQQMESLQNEKQAAIDALASLEVDYKLLQNSIQHVVLAADKEEDHDHDNDDNDDDNDANANANANGDNAALPTTRRLQMMKSWRNLSSFRRWQPRGGGAATPPPSTQDAQRKEMMRKLWDAQRLARVILGNSRDTSDHPLGVLPLHRNGSDIVHAIRSFALIQKELEIVKRQNQALLKKQQMQMLTTTTTTNTSMQEQPHSTVFSVATTTTSTTTGDGDGDATTSSPAEKSIQLTTLADLEWKLQQWKTTFDEMNTAHDHKMTLCQLELEEVCSFLDHHHGDDDHGDDDHGDQQQLLDVGRVREQLQKLVDSFSAFPSKARMEELEAQLLQQQQVR